MLRTILFKEFDPWHPKDQTGFNKTGYVTENGVVIYPRRSRIARKSLAAIMKKPHLIVPLLPTYPRAEQVEIFFTKNLINTTMFVMGMQLIGQPESPFWDNPIKMPMARAAVRRATGEENRAPSRANDGRLCRRAATRKASRS
jgi:hypothetical protein